MVREGRVLTSTIGKPTFGMNYYVTAYQVGAQVTSASSGTTVTVRAGHGFSVNDKLILNTDSTFYRRVTVAGTLSLTLDQSLSVAEDDFLVNLGPDTGSSSPNYDGSGAAIYEDMDYSNVIANSTVQTTSEGRYRYFHLGIPIWELVRTSTGTPIDLFTYSGTETNVVTSLFNVQDYGAIGDGITDDYTAVNAAKTAAAIAGGTVYFPASSGGYRVGTSITFPYNVGVKFDMNAAIKVDLGFIARIQGPIDAGLYQIFDGAGNVYLFPLGGTEVLIGPTSIPETPIQWWGAFPNTTSDCGPAIQKAITNTQQGTFITFHGGTFKIATNVAVSKRYFNLRGETGGYSPGAGYPTFIWTGTDAGTMFTFTDPFGIDVAGCSFDGDFSANTVVALNSDSSATVTWNCRFDKCGFIACRGDALTIGGQHATYNDDFSQLLFMQCWFDRPSGRTSDADGNAVSLSTLTAGTHVRIRAWNSYNVTFDNCNFFSIGTSSDSDQDARIGIEAQGGYLRFEGCLFVNRGIDIMLDDPTAGTPGNGLLPSQIEVYGGESQSAQFLKTYTGTAFTSQKNSIISGFRHLPSLPAGSDAYSPSLSDSIYWDGPGTGQATLVLVGNNFHRNVNIGPNALWVEDIGTRFAVGYDFTGTKTGVFGILGSRGTTNRAAYGRGLRMGSNITWFGSGGIVGGHLQDDLWINQNTSDSTLARDFIRKQVQAASSTGKMNPFFGSMNYEGDCTTNVNGAFDFDSAYSGGVLSMVTKIIPQGPAIYEILWRIGVDDSSTAAKSSQDAGVGHIYIIRDYIAAADSWKIEYRATSDYTNIVGTNLTCVAYLWDTSYFTSIAYNATLPVTYRLALKIQTLTADSHATFYGIIRRIM